MHSQTLTEYQHNIVPQAPWAALWIDTLIDPDLDSDARFRELAEAALRPYSDHETPYALIKGIARLGAKILAHGSHEQTRTMFLD